MINLFKDSNKCLDEKFDCISDVLSGVVEKFTNTLSIIDEKIKDLTEKVNHIEENISNMEFRIRNEVIEKITDLEIRIKNAFEALEKGGTSELKEVKSVFEPKHHSIDSKTKMHDSQKKVEPSSQKPSTPMNPRVALQSELKELFKRMGRR